MSAELKPAENEIHCRKCGARAPDDIANLRFTGRWQCCEGGLTVTSRQPEPSLTTIRSADNG